MSIWDEETEWRMIEEDRLREFYRRPDPAQEPCDQCGLWIIPEMGVSYRGGKFCTWDCVQAYKEDMETSEKELL